VSPALTAVMFDPTTGWDASTTDWVCICSPLVAPLSRSDEVVASVVSVIEPTLLAGGEAHGRSFRACRKKNRHEAPLVVWPQRGIHRITMK